MDSNVMSKKASFFLIILLLFVTSLSLRSDAQEHCPGSISVNEAIGAAESVLSLYVTCTSASSDEYVGVEIEIENIRQIVYYISFVGNGSISSMNNYMFDMDPVPIFPQQTIVLDVIEMAPGSSFNVVANKWGNSISQDASILAYNLAYGYLKAIGVEPAYSTDSRWERLSTITQIASITPWTEATVPDGHLYWSMMESGINYIKETAIQPPVNPENENGISRRLDYFNRSLALAELLSTVPKFMDNIVSIANALSPSSVVVTEQSVKTFFVKIKLLQIAVLSGPRIAPVLVDLFYGPSITSTRVYFKPLLPVDLCDDSNTNVCEQVVMDSPYLINPTNETTTVAPTFEWGYEADYTSFEFVVSLDETFTQLPVLALSGLTELSFDYPLTLTHGMTYYWRVRAYDADQDMYSEWSDVGSFTTESDTGEDGGGEPALELLDVIFVIDTTGSMSDDIDAVQNDAINIIDAIAASSTNWQIGVVTYRDHPSEPYGDSGDYTSRIELPFSSNRSDIVNAINGIQVAGGGDFEESVYSGLMEAIAYPWRDGAKKAIILMGDAPPHDPEPFTGYTLASTLQAAFDVDPANVYPIIVGNDAATRQAFQSLADGSSGRLFIADTADEVVETMFETINSIANEPELSRLLTIGGLARVNTSGADRLNLRSGAGTEFPIIDRLNFGTTVTVLEGPVFNAPYLWWNIRTPDGVEGWAVEAADGLVTLVPVDEEVEQLPILAYPPDDRQTAIRNYTSIWSLTEFVDITSPGTVEHEITVSANQTYRFAFIWCGDTPAELAEFLAPLSVEFSINDIVLTEVHILQTNLDGVCEIWETLLTDWTPGEQVTIQIRYTLSEPLTGDSEIIYEAGDYYQRILVNPQ